MEISVQRTLRVVGIGDKYGTSSPLDIAYDRAKSLIGRFVCFDNDEEDIRTDAFHSDYSTSSQIRFDLVSNESKLIGADTFCHELHRANT